MIQDISPYRLDDSDGIRLDRKELAAAEWHPRTRLPDGRHSPFCYFMSKNIAVFY